MDHMLKRCVCMHPHDTDDSTLCYLKPSHTATKQRRQTAARQHYMHHTFESVANSALFEDTVTAAKRSSLRVASAAAACCLSIMLKYSEYRPLKR
jgi:hypothetical protein